MYPSYIPFFAGTAASETRPTQLLEIIQSQDNLGEGLVYIYLKGKKRVLSVIFFTKEKYFFGGKLNRSEVSPEVMRFNKKSDIKAEEPFLNISFHLLSFVVGILSSSALFCTRQNQAPTCLRTL